VADAKPQGFRRRIGFGSGFRAGVVATFLCGLLLVGWGAVQHMDPQKAADGILKLRTDGVRLSARGVSSLTLEDGHDSIRQHCLGRCDDLSVDSDDSFYGGYGAKLLDAEGVAIPAQWTASAATSRSTTVTLDGGGIVKLVPKHNYREN